MHHVTIESPIGALTLVAGDDGLHGVYFEQHRHPPRSNGWTHAPHNPTLVATRAQLAEYFAGTRTTFDLPLAPRGTPFQQRVWTALRAIPFGETVSYLDIARQLGDPKATRAVGAANGRNPLSIVVPCHRVVGTSGALTGFGGGVERKRWLLSHEGALLL